MVQGNVTKMALATKRWNAQFDPQAKEANKVQDNFNVESGKHILARVTSFINLQDMLSTTLTSHENTEDSQEEANTTNEGELVANT